MSVFGSEIIMQLQLPKLPMKMCGFHIEVILRGCFDHGDFIILVSKIGICTCIVSEKAT